MNYAFSCVGTMQMQMHNPELQMQENAACLSCTMQNTECSDMGFTSQNVHTFARYHDITMQLNPAQYTKNKIAKSVRKGVYLVFI